MEKNIERMVSCSIPTGMRTRDGIGGRWKATSLPTNTQPLHPPTLLGVCTRPHPALVTPDPPPNSLVSLHSDIVLVVLASYTPRPGKDHVSLDHTFHLLVQAASCQVFSTQVKTVKGLD